MASKDVNTDTEDDLKRFIVTSDPETLDVSEAFEEITTEEELELSRKLRACCHPWGVEMDHKLSESATLLLEMGKLYLGKAKESNGMAQKLAFIKCAALIAGAKVRFEKHVLDEAKELEAIALYRQMIAELLKVSNANNPNEDVLETSEIVESTLKLLRNKEREQFCEKLKLIEYDKLSEAEIFDKQREKIAYAKDLSERETFIYTYLMNLISKKCFLALGEAPCRMSLVGLGSLARKEVTLYSDFEHVILLEEGIDDSPRGNIREYFRWYSVLFQVIIIGIGETCIPSVGVKSLNDLYCGDPKKNWFYDKFTPSGVSFDGRLPHACKIPLGKQEPTTNKKHVVELIQPISKMVRFLSTDEDLKNGYHLRDVLLRTCLVDGDKEIYLKFKEAALRHVINPNRDEQVMDQARFVTKNVNDFIGEKKFELYSEKVKDIFYRPITVLISSIARIFNFDGSNFEFLSWLREKESEFNVHKIEFALAVAWEIRAKLYSSTGRQQARSLPKDICDSVGKKCVVACFKTIKILAHVFHDAWNKRLGLLDFLGNLVECMSKDMDAAYSALGSIILQRFGFADDILPNFDYEKVEEYFSGRNEIVRGTLQLAFLHYTAGNESNDNKEEHFFKVSELLKDVPEDVHMTHEYVVMMTEVHEQRGNYKESYDLLSRWMPYCRQNKSEIGMSDMENFRMQLQRASVCSKSLDDEEFVARAEKEMASNPDPLNQMAFSIPLSAALVKLKRTSEASACLRKAIDICEVEGSGMSSKLKRNFANKVFNIQQYELWADDSLRTAEFIESMQDSWYEKSLLEDIRFDLKPVKEKEQKDTNAIKMCIAAVRLLKSKNDFSFASVMSMSVELSQLLSETGLENFPNVRHHFEGVPPQAFKTPIFHIDLSITLSSYQKKFNGRSLHEIGQELTPFLQRFEETFLHPYQLNPMKSLTASVVLKSLELKGKIEENRKKYFHLGKNAFEELCNQALNCYATMNIDKSAEIFWRVLQQCPSFAFRKKSCIFLMHIITISPFISLIKFIQNHRIRMKEKHSFPNPGELEQIFNGAVRNYVEHHHKRSTRSLWKIICFLLSKDDKITGKLLCRSVEMLMLVIMTVLENSGYTLGATDTHFTIEGTNPSRNTCIADAYNGLLLDANGTRKMLQVWALECKRLNASRSSSVFQ